MKTFLSRQVHYSPDEPPPAGAAGAAGTSGTTPPPASSPAAGEVTPPTGGGVGAKTFTQEDLDRIAADARKSGRAKAAADLLASFGFKDEAEAKAFLTTARAKAEAELTESQRLQAKYDELLVEVKALRGFKLRTLAEKKIEVAIASLKLEFVAPAARDTAFKIALEAAGEIDPEGNFEGIEQAIADLKDKHDYLFRKSEEAKQPTPPDLNAKAKGKNDQPPRDDKRKRELGARLGVQSALVPDN